jgi:hypothetical protein
MYSSSGEEAVTLKHRLTGAPGEMGLGVTALTVEPLILARAGAATNTNDKNNTNASGNASATTRLPNRFVDIHFLLRGCSPLFYQETQQDEVTLSLGRNKPQDWAIPSEKSSQAPSA